jgi:NAD-dependent deacetylase
VTGRTATVEEAVGLLSDGRVVAFTGAGISAESGIPTFRDSGGLWDRFDPNVFGTWEGLGGLAATRPQALAAFLGELRRVLAEARPGPAHLALAEMEQAGVLDAVVTQNVDGLHQEAGSGHVVEVHGSFLRRACLSCGRRTPISRQALLDDLDRAIVGLRSAFVTGLSAILPTCPACGDVARPDFVAFGEAVQGYEEAERLVLGCRALLVVGTSGEVFPVAGLPGDARKAGAAVVEVAPGETDVEADLLIRGHAGDVLSRLAGLLAGSRP